MPPCQRLDGMENDDRVSETHALNFLDTMAVEGFESWLGALARSFGHGGWFLQELVEHLSRMRFVQVSHEGDFEERYAKY